jgi:putative transposase
MDKRKRLQIELSRQERKQVEELLSGGVQPVRAVIRALVLRQIDEGRTTVEAGAGVGISAKAAWEIGKRYREGGVASGPLRCASPRSEAAAGRRARAAHYRLVCRPPPAGRARWSVRLIAQEAVNRAGTREFGLVASVMSDRSPIIKEEMRTLIRSNTHCTCCRSSFLARSSLDLTAGTEMQRDCAILFIDRSPAWRNSTTARCAGRIRRIAFVSLSSVCRRA